MAYVSPINYPALVQAVREFAQPRDPMFLHAAPETTKDLDRKQIIATMADDDIVEIIKDNRIWSERSAILALWDFSLEAYEHDAIEEVACA
jgi:hypothetical protein